MWHDLSHYTMTNEQYTLYRRYFSCHFFLLFPATNVKMLVLFSSSQISGIRQSIPETSLNSYEQ